MHESLQTDRNVIQIMKKMVKRKQGETLNHAEVQLNTCVQLYVNTILAPLKNLKNF